VLSTPLKFMVVGVLGFAVQLTTLATLTAAGWRWLPATVVAVESAIVQNYIWHRVFTWAGRRGSFIRFNASAAATSIAGNVLLMWMLVGAGLPVIPANILSVAIVSVANFLIADRWVFAAMVWLVAVPVHAAPSPAAIASWNQYVGAAEARMSSETGHPIRSRPEGNTIDIGSATISDWRGSVVIPHVTLDAFLRRLQNPGTPPPQEDVTEARVISRAPDALHLYIRLVRRAIITVTYDTEHDMTFRRISEVAASARSVATRIDEVGGGDKGFLWKLNSYWYYEQTPAGVLVSLQSLTLSRDVPLLVKPVAGRIVPAIARESMQRTLDALKAYFA